MTAPAPSCPHVAASGPPCTTPVPGGVCGHGAELHGFTTDNTRRTACTVHTGRQGTPCGCPRYTTEEVTA